LPQPVAGRIGERASALMHPQSRRLAEDCKPRARRGLKDGTRLMRQRRAPRRVDADAARPDFFEQHGETVAGFVAASPFGNVQSFRHALTRESSG